MIASSRLRDGKNGEGPGVGRGDGDGSAASQLKDLLANLPVLLKRLAADKDPNGDFEKALSRVDGEVAHLIAQMDSKIDQLAEAARRIALADPGMAGNPNMRDAGAAELSTRGLLALVADIIREFHQPLSVIQASVIMLQTLAAGAPTPMQQQLVALVGKSQARLDALVERLERIL